MLRSTQFLVIGLLAILLTPVIWRDGADGAFGVAAQERGTRQQEGKQQEGKPQEQTPSSPEEKSPDNLPAPVDPKSFRVGPEDVLGIEVWQEPQLSGMVAVRPDGVITVRLIGEQQVNGLTPEQIKEKLTGEFSKLVNNPIVMISVQQVRSKKYLITGTGVQRQGEFPLVVPTTVLDALVRSGGFTEFADKKKIIIKRGETRFYFNYNDYVKKGKNPEQNRYLESGDLIIVN
jgi:polysaccharide export outer membrane protein